MTVQGTDLALLAAIVLLLLATGFLSLAATSLAHVTRARAQTLAAAGQRRAERVVDLLHRTEDVHTPLTVARLTCVLVEATLVGVVGDRLLGTPGLVLATATNVVVVFVLAMAAPSTWAGVHPAGAAMWVAGPVWRLVTFPPVAAASRALVRLSNLVVPAPGLPAGPYARPEPHSEEEASTRGVIAHSQRELVESIAEFADTVVREVMSPRTDMVIVGADFRIGDVIEVSLLNGYSRLPVCGADVDDVAGLVYAKDLMRAERDGFAHRPVAELVRSAAFVPETKRLPDLLREMQHQQLHMAIVVDEYGGTAGLVTLEDIIEQLVGDIADEFDVADTLIEPLPSGELLVRGWMPFQELNTRLDRALPEGDWDTAGGLMYGLLGHLPVTGEVVRTGGWKLTAERIQGRRIRWIRISPTRTGGSPGSRNGAAHTAAGNEANRAGDAPRGTWPDDPGGANRTTPADDDRRSTGDGGFVGGGEALPFGLLIFAVGALLAAQAWAVVDAKFAVDSAAREAARHYVEAEVVDAGGAVAAEETATDAGLAALAAHGRDRSRATVDLVPGAGGYHRCAEVTATATYRVPAVGLPWIGGWGRGLAVRAERTEIVDPYRDGVPGVAEGC